MCGALRTYFSLTRGLIKRKLLESCCSYIFKLTRSNLTKSRIGQILVKLLNLKYPPETHPPPPPPKKKFSCHYIVYTIRKKKIVFFFFLLSILFIFDYMSSVEVTRTKIKWHE